MTEHKWTIRAQEDPRTNFLVLRATHADGRVVQAEAGAGVNGLNFISRFIQQVIDAEFALPATRTDHPVVLEKLI